MVNETISNRQPSGESGLPKELTRSFKPEKMTIIRTEKMKKQPTRGHEILVVANAI